ncbi:hypothetical protein [Chitinophaga barathri]|uniref:Uncharacterized protein n=1 Tax=Chitinophaga barathri TaxID=1647451 RepID=A0A3N4MBZ2_9BACT|nr:hypothetical protein [Chitinophaga barathri]RPD39346.1 hypothetical protein EG028_19670 [Chitinophaga barathri]
MKTNHEYLANQTKYTGFGTMIEIPIADAIAKNGDKFTVPYRGSFNGKEFEAELSFKKSEKTGNYFFQSYTLLLEREGFPLQHTFYINNKPFDPNKPDGLPRNFTLKEAFNLLEGRPVLKTMEFEGEVTTRWRTLQIFEDDGAGGLKLAKGEDQKNFKMRSYPAESVKLDEAVGNLKPKELERPSAYQERIRSLERGNITRFTIVSGDNEYPRDIEVSMKYRTLIMNIPPKGKVNEVGQEHAKSGETVSEQKQMANSSRKSQETAAHIKEESVPKSSNTKAGRVSKTAKGTAHGSEAKEENAGKSNKKVVRTATKARGTRKVA